MRSLLEPAALDNVSRVAIKELGHISMDGCLPVFQTHGGLVLELGEGEFTETGDWVGAGPQLVVEAGVGETDQGRLVLGMPLGLLQHSEDLYAGVGHLGQAKRLVELDGVEGPLGDFVAGLLDAVGYSLGSICGGELEWASKGTGVVASPDEYPAETQPVTMSFPVRLQTTGKTYALTLALELALAQRLSRLVLENDGTLENGPAQRLGPVTPAERVTYRRAYFQELGSNGAAHDGNHLDLLMDVPLEVTVELGRTRRQVREVLELGPGSVIELDKLAGEPVDIHINQRLIARGEVVVVEENFGVRITDIVSPSNRIGPVG